MNSPWFCPRNFYSEMLKGSWRGERVNVFLEGHGSIFFPPQSILLLISLSLSQSVCLSLISHSLTLSLPMTISNSVLRENHFIPSKKIKGQFIQKTLISDRHCQRKIKHSNDFSLLLARIHLYFKGKKWSTCFESWSDSSHSSKVKWPTPLHHCRLAVMWGFKTNVIAQR